MEIRNNLELVDVTYNEKKAVLTFLDEEHGEIREVAFNKQSYKDGKYIDDADKAKTVEKWCKEYFNTTFDDLTSAIGTKRDIYIYEKFNSLWEVTMTEKLDPAMVGQIFETQIDEIVDNGIAIVIKFGYEGKTYQSKMTYSMFIEHKNEWFVNPQKKRQQYAKFKEKFHVPVEESDKLIGKTVLVEIKKAFGTYPYAEIKPMMQKK